MSGTLTDRPMIDFRKQLFADERDDVERLLAGQVCRCTGYEPIIAAILETAERRRAGA